MALLKKSKINIDEKLESQMNNKQKSRGNIQRIWEEMRMFFPLVQIITTTLLFSLIVGGYMFIISMNSFVSIITGIISGIIGFYTLVFIPQKIKLRKENMYQLQRYSSNMTFYMQSGYNVLDALKNSRDLANKQIAEDIDLIIAGLERKAILYTDHFKKYHFEALNIFHDNLKVMYENGGNPKVLFDKANKAINFELVVSDKLYRKKSAKRKIVYVLMGMSSSLPLIVRFQTKDVYTTFLSLGSISLIPSILFISGFLYSIYRVQKNALDITVY